jgi:hypothetical protein
MAFTTSNPRYEGKPLLRLLEFYVLWAIEQLPETEAKALKDMTPKLQSVYDAQGEWHQVIAAAVKLPPNMPDMIRDLWVRNTEIARKNQATLTPQQFAEMFVDENLAN